MIFWDNLKRMFKYDLALSNQLSCLEREIRRVERDVAIKHTITYSNSNAFNAAAHFLKTSKEYYKNECCNNRDHKGSDCISNKIILMNESGYPDYLSDRVALINEALKRSKDGIITAQGMAEHMDDILRELERE